MESHDVIKLLAPSDTQGDASNLPPPVISENRMVSYCQHFICVHLTIVMSANEIELSVEVIDPPRRFGADVIQTWLGEPARAYMFSPHTIQDVTQEVIRTVQSIFKKAESERGHLVGELRAVNDRLSEVSMRRWTREEADEAWKSRRYEDAAKLYARLGQDLSQAEEKRLEIARRRSQ